MERDVRSGVTAVQGRHEVQASQHPLALYIHIPFCETRCPYCDFNTYARIEPLIPEYVEALLREISLWADALGHPAIATVFFGGGTPSYIPPEAILRVLETIRSSFSLASDAETTLESNPGDVTPERLRLWRKAGVNRLSIGVQALDDTLLRLLGRRHTAEQARAAYRAARQAEFGNINLDLMYGLPRQSIEQWRRTLEESLAMAPEHLSLYCLTLEEGTPMEARVRQGKLPEPDADLAADMYLVAEATAAQAGYNHYEISNWALPGKACRHNLVYWQNRHYLGVGPGAHSYLLGYRIANLRSPRRYIQLLGNGARGRRPRPEFVPTGVAETWETIGLSLEMGETMMLGLRLMEGVAEATFRERFGKGLREAYGKTIQEMERHGLLEWDSDRLKLTPRGRLLGNEVFQRFLG